MLISIMIQVSKFIAKVEQSYNCDGNKNIINLCESKKSDTSIFVQKMWIWIRVRQWPPTKIVENGLTNYVKKYNVHMLAAAAVAKGTW